MIILDVGEGTALRNEHAPRVVHSILSTADAVEFPKEEIVVKPQLFQWEPPNRPLQHEVFANIHRECLDVGLQCTASVFDKPSLGFLLRLEIPFVKIASRTYLRRLALLVPRGVPIYASYGDMNDETEYDGYVDQWLACVSNYPAEAIDYDNFGLIPRMDHLGISDHTVGLDLYRKYRPRIYEKHFYIQGMKGPSIGPWAIDEDGLAELLRIANTERLTNPR